MNLTEQHIQQFNQHLKGSFWSVNTDLFQWGISAKFISQKLYIREEKTSHLGTFRLEKWMAICLNKTLNYFYFENSFNWAILLLHLMSIEN